MFEVAKIKMLNIATFIKYIYFLCNFDVNMILSIEIHEKWSKQI